MRKINLYKKWIKQDFYFIKQVIKVLFCKNRIFLFDTADHDNLGDHAISIAIIQFIKKYLPEYRVVEIPGGNVLRHTFIYRSLIRENDTIAISGGGFLGDLWPYEEKIVEKVMKNFSKNKMVIFPQTFYVENSSEFKNNHPEFLKKRLLICLRDQLSVSSLKKLFPDIEKNIIFMPDMVCILNEKFVDKKIRSGVGICIRKDKESVLDKSTVSIIENFLEKEGTFADEITTIYPRFLSIQEREVKLKIKLTEFASKKIIITDRLHAMLFSLVTGTHCIAFDNKSKKVSGVYKWIESLPYIHFVNDVSEFENIFKTINLNEQNHYPDALFEEMWMKLAYRIRNL